MSTVDSKEKYETFWRRFFASLIDGFILLPLIGLNEFVERGQPSKSLLLLWAAFIALLPLVYRILLHKLFGQTFGKMITKVKVVDFASEAAISNRQAITRDVVPLVLAAIPIVSAAMLLTPDPNTQIYNLAKRLDSISTYLVIGWFVLEVLFLITSPTRRTAHDFFAGTVVVKTNI